MRMWMIDPKYLCRKHLLGQHVELHMLLGTMMKNKSISGFIMNIVAGKISPLLEPFYLYNYHEEVKKEMLDRGYNHNSDMDEKEVLKALENYTGYKSVRVNTFDSFIDLRNRCEYCRRLIDDA